VNDQQPRLFFVHIQKTAGGTLRRNIAENLQPGELYPAGGTFDADPLDAYWSIPRLRSLPPERKAQIRAYVGHFPYIASQLVGSDVVTLTVLRDPVERTISYLKMRSGDPERQGMSLEQIYEHPFDFPCFIHNHQTKIFAMTTDDKLETFMDVIEIDDDRVEIAKRQLAQVDVLGLQEDYPAMLERVARRFGWPVGEVESTHVSQGEWTVPDSLRERISHDNAIDIEFYEFARDLYRRRVDAETRA
jgi:hypothetical protein